MSADEQERTKKVRRGRVGGHLAIAGPVRVGAGVYSIAHACFECRKSFKIAPRPDFEATCPACGGAVHEMGRSFKAPPARNLAQWTKVKTLYEAGFRFFSYRSVEGPPLPERLSQVESFIRDNPDHPLRVAAPARVCTGREKR